MTLIYHSPHGEPVRVTVAAILEGSRARFGVSRCGKKDIFVKKTGRQISLYRAATDPLVEVRVPKKGSLGKWFVQTAAGIASVVKGNPELLNLEEPVG